jgi:hypothetical protein
MEAVTEFTQMFPEYIIKKLFHILFSVYGLHLDFPLLFSINCTKLFHYDIYNMHVIFPDQIHITYYSFLTMQLLLLEPNLQPFCSVILKIGSHFLLRLAWTMILFFYVSCHCWDDTHVTLSPAFTPTGLELQSS